MWFISRWVSPALSIKTGSIFITASSMGSTTRCILWRGAGTRAPPVLSHPPPPHQCKVEKDELRSEHSGWQTQWPAAFICAAQLRSSVCSNTTPSRLPLLPLSLPLVLKWEIDSCLEGQSAVCKPKPRACTSVLDFTVFLREHSPQQITNPSPDALVLVHQRELPTSHQLSRFRLRA